MGMDLAQLEAAGSRYQAIRAELDQARDELHPLVLEAVRAGVPQKRIVELTGMARENIRALARRHGIEAVPVVPERRRAGAGPTPQGGARSTTR